MTRRVGFTEPDAWNGGFYALELHDAPVRETLRAFEALAELDGWFLESDAEPSEAARRPATSLVDGLAGHGWLALPDGARVPCMLGAPREPDRVELTIPLGGLGAVLPVAAFPFDDCAPHEAWRVPFEEHLASMARRVFAAAPFRLAVIGFEIDAGDELPEAVQAERRSCAYLVPSGDTLSWRARTLP